MKGELMKFGHSFKHHDVSEALISYAEEKMQKLLRYEIKPGTAHFTYSSQRHHCLVEVNIMGGEHIFHAKAKTNDWHASVDNVVERLETQMKKRKNVVKAHRYPEKSREGRMELLTAEMDTDYTRLDPGAADKKVG